MQNLLYLGKETKKVKVKNVLASSPQRILECSPGKTFRIGADISEKIALSVNKHYPGVFRIETVTQTPTEVFQTGFQRLIETSGLTDAEISDIVSKFFIEEPEKRGRKKKNESP